MPQDVKNLKARLFFQRSDFAPGFFEKAENVDRWAWLTDRFDTSEPKTAFDAGVRIPKIIHQVWVGKQLPAEYRIWTDSWRRLNPGWEYRLWDEKAILKFGLRNEKAFRKSLSLGVKSDIARYEILDRLGGIYADTDFECLKACENVARGSTFFAGLIFANAPVISNGLLGFAPGHPILAKVISGLGEPVRTKDGMQILEKTGPGYFTKVVFDNRSLLADTDVIFPSSYFFPVPNFIDKKSTTAAEKRSMIREWSFATHYWETSWLKPSPWRRFLSRGKRLAMRLLRA